MLKISQVENPGGQRFFKLEGRVVGPWVGELQSVCAPPIKAGKALTLDLAEVVFADAPGAALLAKLHRRGVKLSKATPFLKEQLKLARMRAGAAR
jgi:ABC-type transporter Mla MlaB component